MKILFFLLYPFIKIKDYVIFKKHIKNLKKKIPTSTNKSCHSYH